MEYYVIAEKELVIAFRLAGVDGVAALSKDEVREAFFRITGQNPNNTDNRLEVPVLAESERPRVLVITEGAASMIDDELVQWQMRGEYPLVVEIPGLHGRLAERRSLTNAIREAIGVNV